MKDGKPGKHYSYLQLRNEGTIDVKAYDLRWTCCNKGIYEKGEYPCRHELKALDDFDFEPSDGIEPVI